MFENVKVGDQVIVHHIGWYAEDELREVTNVTAKRFVTGGSYFKKKDGKMVGDSFSYCSIPTDEEVSKIKRELKIKRQMSVIIREFSNYNIVKKMSEDELDLVCEIIKRHKNEQDK